MTVEITSPANETPPLFISGGSSSELVYQTFTSTHSFTIVRGADSNALLDTLSYSFVGAGDNEEHASGFYQFPAGQSTTFYEKTLSRSLAHDTGWHTAQASSDVSCSVGNAFLQKQINYHTVSSNPGPSGPTP